MAIETRSVKLLPVSSLVPNPDNPKKPMRAKESSGLKRSLKKYGFASVLVVAPNQDGTYEVLNGNTRLDELRENSVPEVPCVVMDDLAERDERTEFVLTYDRHHKVYDEERVIGQLRQLAQAGKDVRELQIASGVDNLKQILANQQAAYQEQLQSGRSAMPVMGSIVLHGPAEDIELINAALSEMKKRMSSVTKIAEIIVQAEENIDLNDETFATILLATIVRYEEALA
jgi:hypothetical protein